MKKVIFFGILIICVITLLISHKNSNEVFLNNLKEDIKLASEVVVRTNMKAKDSVEKDYRQTKKITEKDDVDNLVNIISHMKLSSKPLELTSNKTVEKERILDFFDKDGYFIISIKYPFEFVEIKDKYVGLEPNEIDELEKIIE